MPIEMMLARRSHDHFEDRAPDRAQLELILEAATTVPDHGALRPWRFVVVTGDGREAFADALLSAEVALKPDTPEKKYANIRKKAFVAPTQIVIISSLRDSHVAEWEQVASAATAGYAIVLAAHLLGLAAGWKALDARRGPGLDELFGLGDDERIMGWINIGTAVREPRERRNVVPVADVTTLVKGDAAIPWA